MLKRSKMTSNKTGRSFMDGVLVSVSEKPGDSERWRKVKELPANFVVPNFGVNENVGSGRYKSTGLENVSFVGPVVDRKLTLIPYKGYGQPPEDFEVLVLNPDQFVWRKTDKTKALLPPDVFYTGVITDFGVAYIGMHENYGIGMVLDIDNVWTYNSKDGKKFLSFNVLCYK